MFTSQTMFPRLLRVPLLTRTILITISMMTQIVYSKPQDSSMFENVASQAIAVIGNMAEMAGNTGMISKKMGFDLPFAKANSETQIGTGAAMRNNDDDSSEEDRRRKRSTDLRIFEDAIKSPLPLAYQHAHRGKRSPCYFGLKGTGANEGTAAGGGGSDYDDLDVAERRRRARKRIAAAKKRASSTKRTTNNRRKKLVNDDDNENQVLQRRKRQTELDDLNQNMGNVSNSFKQQAQQIAEKVRNIWESLMGSMNNMAQKLKQHFNGQDSTNTTEI